MNIANYPSTIKSKWFNDLLCCLDDYKTEGGRYIFPEDWLPEKTVGAVGGKYMSFGESRRKKDLQIYRLMEIIYILLRKKTVTAKELSERFHVSPRTIYRDIDVLSLSGIPVYTEKGKGGGISMLPDFVLSKSFLSENEQNEILSSLQGLTSMKTGDTGGILNKLSAIFNKNTVDWLDVDFTDWSIAKESYFNDFKTSILECRITEFDYFGVSGVKTFRRIEPIKILF